MIIFGNIVHVVWCDHEEEVGSFLYYLQHVCLSLVFFFGYWVVGVSAIFASIVDLELVIDNKFSRQVNLLSLFFGFCLSSVLFIQIEKPFESVLVLSGGAVSWGLVGVAIMMVCYRIFLNEVSVFASISAVFGSISFIAGCFILVFMKDESLYYVATHLA